MDQDKDIQAARDKLAARFANATQIGGKGKHFFIHPRSFIYQPCGFRYPEKKEEAC
jgi:hypothetical protein